MHMRPELPDPPPEAAAHSRLVSEMLRGRIAAAGGWIDFSEYMAQCLYAPGLGYYSAGSVKLGAAGDFVTAPEISPLFGRCIARSLAPALADLREPVILEIGGGRGNLAAEILLGLESRGILPRRYLMLEVSAELRSRQCEHIRARVPQHAGRVEWLDRLPDEPLEAILIANEVADALPVSRFRLQSGNVQTLGVQDSATGFCDASRPAAGRLVRAVEAIPRATRECWGEGYTSEINTGLPAWVSALAHVIERGWLLLFDYGWPRHEYYHPQRAAGTLTCHYRHRFHFDPYFLPGLQDITAWVDFTTVAEAAAAAGLEVSGFTTQANFLLDAGIDQAMAEMPLEEDAARVAASREARILLLPGEMGEAVKVMGLRRGACVAPLGFELRDLRDRL